MSKFLWISAVCFPSRRKAAHLAIFLSLMISDVHGYCSYTFVDHMLKISCFTCVCHVSLLHTLFFYIYTHIYSDVCTQIPVTSQWYVPVPFFSKSRRWAHTPEKGTWLWTLQICIKKTWCPSQWYVPILDGHLSWDSPQMSENPHPALRYIYI